MAIFFFTFFQFFFTSFFIPNSCGFSSHFLGGILGYTFGSLIGSPDVLFQHGHWMNITRIINAWRIDLGSIIWHIRQNLPWQTRDRSNKKILNSAKKNQKKTKVKMKALPTWRSWIFLRPYFFKTLFFLKTLGHEIPYVF